MGADGGVAECVKGCCWVSWTFVASQLPLLLLLLLTVLLIFDATTAAAPSLPSPPSLLTHTVPPHAHAHRRWARCWPARLQWRCWPPWASGRCWCVARPRAWWQRGRGRSPAFCAWRRMAGIAGMHWLVLSHFLRL